MFNTIKVFFRILSKILGIVELYVDVAAAEAAAELKKAQAE